MLITGIISRSCLHYMCYAIYPSVFGFQFEAQRVQQEQTPPWICNCDGSTRREANRFVERVAAQPVRYSCLHSAVTVCE